MPVSEAEARRRLTEYGQQHVLRFWPALNDIERNALLAQIESIDFPLMKRLTDQWVHKEPAPETFRHLAPIPIIPRPVPGRTDAADAREAGEAALRAGRVGLFLVAGGQGTRLDFAGPKGAYPIGPVSGRSLLAFHAEKIHALQRRYGCTLPWYIMVSDANAAATHAFFQENAFFGLREADILFLRQRMVPCVDEQGRFMLAARHQLAMNPNGHGGCLPAMVEHGVLDDARRRGVDVLSYFQVDNWAVKVADPVFIGYHVLRNAEMSSKNHRKQRPREAVGIHCLCDDEYRVIEYTELDRYPQLLETDDDGQVVYAAGNPAIHLLAVDFVGRVCEHYDTFPWHRAHKKIPHLDEHGTLVLPTEPNGYKFETFVFDALRFVRHAPVGLEIDRPGEYTPIKSLEGPNSVQNAWRVMGEYWAAWFETAGCRVPRDAAGQVTVKIEISPQFALSRQEFLDRTAGWTWPAEGPLAIGPDGAWIAPDRTIEPAEHVPDAAITPGRPTP